MGVLTAVPRGWWERARLALEGGGRVFRWHSGHHGAAQSLHGWPGFASGHFFKNRMVHGLVASRCSMPCNMDDQCIRCTSTLLSCDACTYNTSTRHRRVTCIGCSIHALRNRHSSAGAAEQPFLLPAWQCLIAACCGLACTLSASLQGGDDEDHSAGCWLCDW